MMINVPTVSLPSFVKGVLEQLRLGAVACSGGSVTWTIYRSSAAASLADLHLSAATATAISINYDTELPCLENSRNMSIAQLDVNCAISVCWEVNSTLLGFFSSAPLQYLTLYMAEWERWPSGNVRQS